MPTPRRPSAELLSAVSQQPVWRGVSRVVADDLPPGINSEIDELIAHSETLREEAADVQQQLCDLMQQLGEQLKRHQELEQRLQHSPPWPWSNPSK